MRWSPKDFCSPTEVAMYISTFLFSIHFLMYLCEAIPKNYPLRYNSEIRLGLCKDYAEERDTHFSLCAEVFKKTL